ncbi:MULTISPECIES: arsenate reductase family protein [unclassified Enterococcus]|uniref:arsenate reductase family protein n=1 Tax=unclassified Enterococcus TaxID=2608891 RepID=UPI0015521F62|nr:MULTISPECIES: arsenate reductase family protein [unclassified Enterococcus]MBS7578120.1 arsenate reductase family protein [Enterococcus sp. MMGLQ5-2]MBS7585380.1 arsenate reductase family protein [Enterococcus sp. MMGLQ5-1]NPD13237.1 arsenate reductase family protein [Enterococcus sp. MMGLQ5-1]NPD37951.1 arsenate reductase family protein [Enterococcus sp. MMGLQ5-2]
MDFIEHPGCSTCKKAKHWLENHQISFNDYDIRQDTPSKKQILEWLKQGRFQSKQLFNTSGQKYRELGLKDQLAMLDDAARAKLLASDGMLIKRPLLVKDGQLLAVGFKEAQYQAIFGN